MISKSVIATAPDGSQPVVSATEVKSFLRIDGTEDDTLLATLVTVATRRLEEFISRKFITQTWDIYFDAFPREDREAFRGESSWWDGTKEGAMTELVGDAQFIDLPFGPLQSITYLKTYDNDGTAYTMTASQYYADTKSPFGRLGLTLGNIWPTTVLRPANGVEIRGVFGMSATAAALPAEVRQATMLMVSKMYENRGDATSSEFFGASGFTIPGTAQMLLEPYRIFRLGKG